jgi:hypothetical protein
MNTKCLLTKNHPKSLIKFFKIFDNYELMHKFDPSSCYWFKRRKERVVGENHQDCIADIDFHIWNLRISASLPWFRPFIRQ